MTRPGHPRKLARLVLVTLILGGFAWGRAETVAGSLWEGEQAGEGETMSVVHDRGGASAVPAGEDTSAVPAGGDTSAVPAGGDTSAVPARGDTSAVPAGGITSAVPAGGDTSAVAAGGDTSAVPAPADTCRPTPEALLVGAVRTVERGEINEGLDALAEIVAARPSWRPAESAFAGTLLRSGQFREAAERFSALVGEEVARGLARGTLMAHDLTTPLDPEDVLGLAIARHYLGDYREADRLYRSYADLVGPSSERAARAYLRLSEMYSEIDVSWGDAAAERDKALAVDPLCETKQTLPDLPDVESIAETEPYTREIALATDRPAPEGGVASLPSLIAWEPPTYPELPEDTKWERGSIEILVGVTGRPDDLALPAALDLGSEPGAALGGAAMAWCFEPAVGESGAVAAWITFGVDVPAVPADSLAGAAPDSAGVAPGAPPRKEGERPKR